MKNILKLDNMSTLTPIEQVFNEMSRGWNNVFDFTPAFTGIETAEKWPRYTILKDKKDENKFKIMIAAAGLSKENFKITALKNKLCVTYNEEPLKDVAEDGDYEVVSNTIARRKFTQYFTAPETYIIKVSNAEMKDGMLEIYAETVIPKDMKEIEYKIK